MNDFTEAMRFFADVRIDPEVTGQLVRIAARDAKIEGLMDRLEKDVCFNSRALHMGHEVLLATTMAQSAKADFSFDGLLASLVFGGNDRDLSAVARIMVNKVMSVARLPDPEVSEELLASRFGAILQAIA